MRAIPILLALALADTLRPGVAVKDEGVAKGQATTVNCVGTGGSCAVSGGVWTLNLTGGGGGATLPSTTSLLKGDGAGGAAAYAGATCSAGTYASAVAGAGTLTCSTPPGTYALPDATSAVTGGVRLTGDLGGTATSPTVPGLAGKEPTITTLPQTKGGTGAGALTCSAGQHLTSNGTAYSCSADTGGGGAPTTAQYWVGAADAGLSAEKDLSGFTGLVLNTAGTPSAKAANTCTNQFARSDNASGVWTCAGVAVADHTATGTPSSSTFLRGDNTWATPTATAAPAGSSGQIQWNNGGTAAGAANANIDASGYFLLPAAAEPSAPANGVVVWSEPRATSAQLAYKAPLGGDDYAQGSVWNKHRAWTAPTGASAGKSDTGWATTLVGTAAATTATTTNYAGAIKRLTYTSGTTASTPVEMRVSSPAFFWRGNAAGLGGFFCNFKWTNPVHNAGSDKMLVGMVNSVAALAGTTVPSAAATGQTAYAGWDAGGTAISLCGNDGTGSAGCVACNSTDFPVNSTTAVFSLSMFAAPNGSTIEMELKRLDTSVTACTRSISTAADLPANTSFLAPRIWGSNGTTAANFGLNFIGMYCETDN